MNENDQDRRSNARKRAQKHFASAEERDTLIKQEAEARHAQITAKSSRLRELRLAKEAEEAAAAPKAEEKPTKKSAKPRARKMKRAPGY